MHDLALITLETDSKNKKHDEFMNTCFYLIMIFYLILPIFDKHIGVIRDGTAFQVETGELRRVDLRVDWEITDILDFSSLV